MDLIDDILIVAMIDPKLIEESIVKIKIDRDDVNTIVGNISLSREGNLFALFAENVFGNDTITAVSQLPMDFARIYYASTPLVSLVSER